MALRDLLTVVDLPRAVVDCSEWKTTLDVRALSLGERKKLMALAEAQWSSEAERTTALSVWLVIYGVIEPDGTTAFTEADFDALLAKNPAVIDRLALQIGKLSNLGDAADGLEKNSETTQSGGSSSA